MLNSPTGNNWKMAQRNWETDLDRPLGTEKWSQIWRDLHKISKSVKNKMIYFNIIHRTYFTPVRLHSMNPSVSDCCWHCQQERGTFFLMVWACPKIKSFWERVTESLGGIIGHYVVCDPILCLLNHMDEGAWSKYKKQLIITRGMTAKRLIASNWKEADHLDIGRWLQTLLETISMEGAASTLLERCNEGQFLWTEIINMISRGP